MEKTYKAFKFSDIFLYAFIALLGFLLFIFINPFSGEKVSLLTCEENGKTLFSYDYTLNKLNLKDGRIVFLSETESEISVKYFDGCYNEIVILKKESAVYVKSADCPTQVCVNTGKINKVNSVIVCAPHNLVLTLRAGER